MNQKDNYPWIKMDSLLAQLRGLIAEARTQTLRAVVDVIQVRICWEIGRHIVEFEQQGGEADHLRSTLIASVG